MQTSPSATQIGRYRYTDPNQHTDPNQQEPASCATCSKPTITAPLGWDAYCQTHLGLTEQELALSMDAQRYTFVELEYLVAMGVNVLRALHDFIRNKFSEEAQNG
jgi:hypothetical protein